MIISFLYDSKYGDKTIDLIFKDETARYKEPSYNDTVDQLVHINGIEGIIIPGVKKDNDLIDWAPYFLLQHVRLSENEKINRLPIFFTNLDDNDEELFNKLCKHEGYYVFMYNDEMIEYIKAGLEMPELKYHDIVDLMANEGDNISRHNLSNDWGAYRLSSQLGQLLETSDSDFLSIKKELSESIYYKKLFLLEKQSFNETKNEIKNINNFQQKIKFIKKHVQKIAIIDDKINSGWETAYSKLFPDSEIHAYDQIEKKIDPETCSNFDLIILDLRLSEDSSDEQISILNAEELSGITLLKKIKEHDPSVPILISTASNKSWSFKTALDNGADGFWSKEDPKRGLSFKYRLENTYDLINSIETIVRWSNQTRCIYRSFKDMISVISPKNSPVACALEKKIKIISGQLYLNKSKFMKNVFGQSGIETTFLVIHSLINEVLPVYRSKEKISKNKIQWYLNINDKHDERKKICIEETKERNGNSTFTYPHLRNVKYFFLEKDFMEKLLKIKNIDHEEYFRLNDIRNQLDIIHGKIISEDIDINHIEFSINDIYKLLDIYYQLFVGSKCTYFPVL